MRLAVLGYHAGMQAKPFVSLIAALADHRVIGSDNRLPWKLPADLRHFKALTLHKPIIMGRKTWESLPGLLPGRQHIVISRNRDYLAEHCLVAQSPEQAIRAAGAVDEVMVIGGAEIYRRMLPLATRMYLTFVRAQFKGDVFFPGWDAAEWVEARREEHAADAANPYEYSFVTLERMGQDY